MKAKASRSSRENGSGLVQTRRAHCPASAGPADDGSADAPRRRLRVLICDNDEVYRLGLRTVLKTLPDIVVVEETAEAARALELSEVFAPHLAVVSSELGGPATGLVEALNRQGVGLILLGSHSACETDRTTRPDGDAYRYLPREANSAEALACVRAALPT